MAPSSRPWTSGAGDGATAYTAAQWASIWRKTFGDGVLRGIGGELAVSGTAAPLTVQAGAAFVDGIFFEDPSTTSLSVSTPAATTGGHVVLRADWSARTARIVAVLNSSGVTTPPNLTQTSGTLYEIRLATFTITNAGVITLTDARPFARYSSRVSSAMLEDGAVSTAAKIANGIITAAKLAAGAVIAALGYTPANTAGDTFSGEVTFQQTSSAQFSQAVARWVHTAASATAREMQAFLSNQVAGGGAAAVWFLRHMRNVGTGSWRDVITYDLGSETLDLSATALRFNGAALPTLSHRQGGSAANWGQPGSTNYAVSGVVRMQAGVKNGVMVSVAGSPQTISLTFPTAFSQPPVVVVTPTASDTTASVDNITTTGCEMTLRNARDTTQVSVSYLTDVHWIAIGPA